MKNTSIFLVVALLVSIVACGESKKDVPAKVKTAFSQKFPNAQNIKWDKENDTEWEAEFKLNSREYSANFNTDGEWMETEYEIEISELPAPVKATLDSEYKDFKIEEPEVSETAKGIVYEVTVEKGKVEREVVIDRNGKVVSDKEESEESDED